MTFLVSMRLGDTPVPIPNTMVKTQAADGTILETVWESRWLPGLFSSEKRRSAVDAHSRKRKMSLKRQRSAHETVTTVSIRKRDGMVLTGKRNVP